MSPAGRAVRTAARLQLISFVRSPLTALFALLLPLNLMLLMSLFALTGYNAPTALVLDEQTPRALAFVDALRAAHHSFELRPMSRDAGEALLRRGKLAAMLEIPRGFASRIGAGQAATVHLTIDNVNLDMSEDVRRAVPAAAAIFAERQGFTGVRVKPELVNLLSEDTGYLEYLGVSAIALAAVIAAALLGGTVVAREWETGGARLSQVSETGATPVLVGRLLAAAAVALLAAGITAGVVAFGFGVPLKHPLEVGAGVLCTVLASTSLGGLAGAGLRKTLVIAPLVLGTQLPFYLDSGALEPQRFDGEALFWLAHLSPSYYGVGILEHGWHDLVVTPEPVWLLCAVLLFLAAAPIPCIGWLARR